MAQSIDRKWLKQHPRHWAAALALVLSACGGGGDSSVANSPGIPPSAQSAQQCSANNPYAASGLKTGTLALEKQWLRSYFDEAYLWYSEVPAVDASAALYSGSDVYTAMSNYFAALKTSAVTATGSKKDKFGFIYPTAAWQALAGSGKSPGYGFELVFGSLVVNAQTPHRDIRIAYIEPGSEAEAKGLQRGDLLVTVDGVSADDNTQAGVNVLNAAAFPKDSDVGVAAHNWVFSRAGATLAQLTLTVADITKKPVLSRSVVTASDGKKIGYMVFNDHLATAEPQLVEAVNYFKAQAIDDLVLDIRYNGGGYLYIASELAFMVAGASRTDSKTFEKLVFSDKRNADTDKPSATTPYYNASTGGSALPSLNLARVFVLTLPGTCSASEAIINGLRGVDVDVRLIGGTTCGKPYGFYGRDNCGVTYFPIEFKGANAKGYGDYTDGFVPGGAGAAGVPGCTASDDLTKALGDTNEAMLATALSYRATGSCPALALGEKALAAGRATTASGILVRNPARENRLLLPR